ncbi:unnamed protein product [Caenorhabditis auriculariae]|uniref:Uncharacterized protein n=1 Tax=Caenorhabditis auriculariae TaxID=2777116 RepID=A0A8S1H072_9PELO|nr:unnamed protein product [Caenorhabditis auriculariae]
MVNNKLSEKLKLSYSSHSDLLDAFEGLVNEGLVFYSGHCVHYNAIEPSSKEVNRIAQILHVSFDQIDERLVEQVSNWKAPVSLSVVLDSWEYYSCTIKLVYIEKCGLNFPQQLQQLVEHPLAEKYLRVHLLVPSETKECVLPDPASQKPTCAPERPSLTDVSRYPVNVARNVARKFSHTDYIAIVDYEHLFSEGLPKDKVELNTMLDEGKAIVFHNTYYPGAHEIPKLEEWLLKDDTSNGLFAMNLRYSKFGWEPQFISRSDIPLHDENFPFQLRDNTVLRWELCRAGYRFHVLDDVFMVHRDVFSQHKSGAKFNFSDKSYQGEKMDNRTVSTTLKNAMRNTSAAESTVATTQMKNMEETTGSTASRKPYIPPLTHNTSFNIRKTSEKEKEEAKEKRDNFIAVSLISSGLMLFSSIGALLMTMCIFSIERQNSKIRKEKGRRRRKHGGKELCSYVET